MTGKPRVLVVDDEPAILRFLKPALEANDYEVSERGDARRGDEAHRQASRPTSWCSTSACRTATARM